MTRIGLDTDSDRTITRTGFDTDLDRTVSESASASAREPVGTVGQRHKRALERERETVGQRHKHTRAHTHKYIHAHASTNLCEGRCD